MSTNSVIIKKMEDGNFKGIYCHWDGYVEHNGKILFENYQDEEKIDQLLSLGSLSVLGEDPGDPPSEHSFKTPVDGYCVAYRRDRGEEKHVDAVISSDLRDLIETSFKYILYFYLREDGKWYIVNRDSLSKTPLKEELESESNL